MVQTPPHHTNAKPFDGYSSDTERQMAQESREHRDREESSVAQMHKDILASQLTETHDYVTHTDDGLKIDVQLTATELAIVLSEVGATHLASLMDITRERGVFHITGELSDLTEVDTIVTIIDSVKEAT